MHSTISQERLQKAQSQDQQLEHLRHFMALSQAPKLDPTLKSFHKIFTELSIGADGNLYRGNQILLPTSLYDVAIALTHSRSHADQDAIKHRIRAHFWFPSLDTIVRQRLQTCHECQIHTRSPLQTPLSSSPIPAHPWESLSLDLYGPLPETSHIVVARCNLSRFPDAKLVKSTSAKDVPPVLATIYTNYGNPKEHKADNGSPFNSKEFRDFSTAGRNHSKHSYPYHLQGNEAECFMKPLEKQSKCP